MSLSPSSHILHLKGFRSKARSSYALSASTANDEDTTSSATSPTSRAPLSVTHLVAPPTDAPPAKPHQATSPTSLAPLSVTHLVASSPRGIVLNVFSPTRLPLDAALRRHRDLVGHQEPKHDNETGSATYRRLTETSLTDRQDSGCLHRPRQPCRPAVIAAPVIALLAETAETTTTTPRCNTFRYHRLHRGKHNAKTKSRPTGDAWPVARCGMSPTRLILTPSRGADALRLARRLDGSLDMVQRELPVAGRLSFVVVPARPSVLSSCQAPTSAPRPQAPPPYRSLVDAADLQGEEEGEDGAGDDPPALDVLDTRRRGLRCVVYGRAHTALVENRARWRAGESVTSGFWREAQRSCSRFSIRVREGHKAYLLKVTVRPSA
ncbi:hypothetical protein K438DRAFT_1978072 [Mycena galopus ATCC 62051]|nr:hypothetical protein K438DRAFT_1978072 [Mycena galopus ATCC 62051]